jgi:triacylglycerol lipase
VESDSPIVLRADAGPLVNAYHLARIARAAYSEDPALAHAGLWGAFPTVATFRAVRIFGVAAGNAEEVVVAFRGTHEDREWVEALAYGQTRWAAGRAHTGCTRLVDAVWTQLLAALYDTGAASRRLWLTGHSIGGAAALLAALRLEHEGFDVHAVTTFGTPAVMDRAAAAGFECRVYRVVNNEDIVPNISWPSLMDTYTHAGERILLTASGRVAAGHHAEHLARRIDRAHSIGQGVLPAGPLHDHRIETYIEKLRRHAELHGATDS